MNTIMAYLDNMFHGLPRTAEVTRLKQDLLSGMEEKYYELKAQGKSENEAVGIVIAEFGNIEELTAELGLTPNNLELDAPELSYEEVYDYLDVKRVNSKWIGIGVLLILIGVAFMVSIDSFFEQLTSQRSQDFGTLIGLVGMFGLIAVAVALFISQGTKLNRFNYLEKGFKLNYGLRTEIMNKQAGFASTYKASNIIGVSILVLSPILIFSNIIIDEIFAPYTVSLFLLLVGCAVFIFVYYGGIQGSFTTLLAEKGTETEEEKKNTKITSALNSILWTLATTVYLFISFVYNSWHISWVVFVAAGILSGMTGSITTLMRANK